MAHAAGDVGWVAWTNGVDSLTAAHTTAIANKLDSTVAGSTYGRSQQGIYVPAGWGSFWQAVRDGASSAPARIAVVTDSIGHGYFSSNLQTKGWHGLLQAALQSAHGDGGSGFYGVMDSNALSVGSQFAGYNTSSEWLAQVGTWVNSTIYEGPGACVMHSTTAGATLTRQLVRGSTIKVYWLGTSSSGQIDWTIDGVAQARITTNGGGNQIGVTTTTGLTAGDHTVVLTSVTTTPTFYCGISGENPTGVVLNMHGQQGQSSVRFSGTSKTYGAANIWAGGSSYPADLIIYSMGVNDYRAGVAPEDYIAYVIGYLNAVKDNTVTKGANDVLFVLPMIGSDQYTTNLYPSYALRLRGIAEQYGAALVCLPQQYRNSYQYAKDQGVWSTGTGNSGAAGGDHIHPGDAGHLDYYNKVIAAVPQLLT